MSFSPPWLARDTSEIESAISRYIRSLYYVRQESIPARLKVEIVFNCWYKGSSRDREAKERGLTKNQIDNIIYKFQTLKSVFQKVRRSTNKKRPKLTGRHEEWILKFIEKRSHIGFTWAEVKYRLLQEFPELGDVSLFTINQLLKRKWSFSYKKLGVTNPVKTTPDHKANLASWWRTIIGLIECSNMYLPPSPGVGRGRYMLEIFAYTSPPLLKIK